MISKRLSNERRVLGTGLRLWAGLCFCLFAMLVTATSASAQNETLPKKTVGTQKEPTAAEVAAATTKKDKTPDKTKPTDSVVKTDSKTKTDPKKKPKFSTKSKSSTKPSAKSKPSTKSSTKSKTTSSKSKTTSSKSKTDKTTNKKDKKTSSKSSKSSPKSDMATEYASMACETWQSPEGKSELGFEFAEGFVQPYPYGNLMRLYDGNRCRHKGVDIGHVGEENGGLGTVINAVTRSQITLIGRVGEDAQSFGRPDTRSGNTVRTGISFPRKILVPGYGVVYPFSRNYGRWRSGMTIVTKVIEGPHAGLTIRYMHMADIRRDLKVGDIVEAGEHIALMGCTAIMDSHPHVHIDFAREDGARIDPAPYIGLPPTGQNCGAPEAPIQTSPQNSKKSSTNVKPKTQSSKGKATLKSRPRASYVSGVISDKENLELRTLEREAEDAERL